MRVSLKKLVAPLPPFVMMFVLAVGVAAPVRAFAQEAATAPAATQSTETAKPAEGEKPKSEGVNEEAFTHTKLVTSIGKALDLDTDTTATLFLWINFAIIFLAIVLPIIKFLPKALKKRRETLNTDLAEARKTTADANSRLSAVEAQLSKLDEEIAKIRAQVEDEIKQDEARIKASIGEESARIVAAAEQEISVAAAQAQRGLKAFAANLAIDQAVKNLTLTAEHDKALIEEFVAEAGKGGTN